MPEPADGHRGDQVAHLGALAAPVAAERDVHVVPQPPRQRHVPAPPEVLDRCRRVGLVEVVGEPDAHQQGDADRHVGVAGEVGVDLHGVRDRGDRELEVGRLTRRREDRVDDRGGQVVRDHDLLEHAPADQPGGAHRVDALAVASTPQLVFELRHPHDRTGHEVGEERQVDREVEQRDRFLLLAVDVDDVADGAEREERDPDRQSHLDQQRRRRQPHRLQDLQQRVDEEPVVLEEAEHDEVGADPDDHRDPGRPVGARPRHQVDHQVVDQRRAGDQQAEPGVPPPVEHVAGGQHEPTPGQRPIRDPPAHAEDDREEDRERHRREQHRTIEAAAAVRDGHPRPHRRHLPQRWVIRPNPRR